MPLGTRIPDLFGADPLDPIQHGPIPPGRMPQLGPIPPPPAGDDVVDRGEGEAAGGDVAVAHVSTVCAACPLQAVGSWTTREGGRQGLQDNAAARSAIGEWWAWTRGVRPPLHWHRRLVAQARAASVQGRQPALQNAREQSVTYNNPAFHLAAVIVERIPGQDFPV